MKIRLVWPGPKGLKIGFQKSKIAYTAVRKVWDGFFIEMRADLAKTNSYIKKSFYF